MSQNNAVYMFIPISKIFQCFHVVSIGHIQVIHGGWTRICRCRRVTPRSFPIDYPRAFHDGGDVFACNWSKYVCRVFLILIRILLSPLDVLDSRSQGLDIFLVLAQSRYYFPTTDRQVQEPLKLNASSHSIFLNDARALLFQISTLLHGSRTF